METELFKDELKKRGIFNKRKISYYLQFYKIDLSVNENINLYIKKTKNLKNE